jgi:hypothetical protein
MLQTHHHSASPLTVVGFYPSGDGFEGTVCAQTASEAKIRVLASQRYSDDGGDLSIACVMDETGHVIDDVPCSADVALLTNQEAVGALLDQASSVILQHGGHPLAADGSDCTLLRGYIEFLECVLLAAPQVFDDLSSLDLDGSIDVDEMLVEFETSSGVVVDIQPSVALAAIADLVLFGTFSSDALQVRELASIAGVALDLACQDAFADA